MALLSAPRYNISIRSLTAIQITAAQYLACMPKGARE